MANRKACTIAEKAVIDSLALALACEDIAKNVIDVHYPEHGKSYRAHMRKECPQFYRLLDELRKAVPRVYKQMQKEFLKDEGPKT